MRRLWVIPALVLLVLAIATWRFWPDGSAPPATFPASAGRFQAGPKPPGRVDVVGFDGASFELIRPLVRMGRAPAFAAIERHGVEANLRSTYPILSAPAWVSAVTGTNPGQHGIYGFYQFKRQADGTEQHFFMTSRQRKTKAIWEVANPYGRTTGLVNIPLTNPAEEVDGYMLSGWPFQRVGRLFWPDGQDFLLLMDGYRFDEMETLEFDVTAPETYLNYYEKALWRRQRKSREIRARMTTDLSWVVFTAPDRIQHKMWQYHQPEPWGIELTVPREVAKGVTVMYTACDQVLREYGADRRDDDTLLVVSDHGFGPVYRRIWATNLLAHYYHEDSRTFDVLYVEGGIRINVEGRDEGGTVPPGRYPSFREQVRTWLLSLRDPDSNQTIFEDVLPKEAIYSGSQLAQAPDLILLPSPGYFLYEAPERGVGRIVDSLPSDVFTGFHKVRGVLLAHGGGIRSGPLAVEDASIIDITPTLLARMNVPVPKEMDGVVLRRILDPGFLAKYPVTASDLPIRRDIAAPPEVAPEMHQQLKSIGYIR